MRANSQGGDPLRISALHISIQANQLEGDSVGLPFGIISKAITELLDDGRNVGTGKVVIAVRVETAQERAEASFCCIFHTKVTFPELSSVAPEFFITFPVVLSKRARALSVEEAGQVTSPLHEAKATQSTYPFVATCVELEGVGTIGLEEKVLIPATVSSSVL